ncbi:MAG: putative Ig domain-containing protein [Nitrospirota bacterium]
MNIILEATLLSIVAALSLTGCGDVSSVSAPPPAPAAPGPLAILTSDPLPAGTVGVNYDVTLAPNGGTAPYTWALASGSPALPNGLTFTPADGKISGKPTSATGTILTEFKLQDSKGQSVQKVLSITVNVAPTPLTILSSSPLPGGSINQLYAIALSGTGGTTPYTWDLKAGSPPLPSGLTLAPSGVITGTPTVTSNASHTFTLTDATSLTVEKTLALTISAIPLSITTTSLPQATANQNYSAQLAASGGTGAYTWGFAGGSPALPTGLTLDASSGAITGLPTGTSNQNITFTVTDQTPPTPQTATKTLQLIVGAAPPTLTITTSSLPPGTVLQSYSATLADTGGTGAHTWDLASGSLPLGLSLSAAGVITGTPTTAGTSSPTFRVRDSGTPQQTATKQLSMTINLPTAPNITTTSLPAGSFNVAYNQTVGVTGGIGTLVWGVISGALPPGLGLNASTGNIAGTPTSTGSFQFTLRVTDQIPQFDEQVLTITIAPPPPPSIASFTLPTGTVNQPYPNTQLTATGGALPYTWSVNSALPNGLSLDPSSGVISGTPLSGSNGVTTHTFTVTDSTAPTNQTNSTVPAKSLTINANVTPVTITTATLAPGTEGQPYTAPSLAASGGTGPYNWSINTSLPAGLSLSASGTITGTPTASGTTSTTFKVLDSTTPNQQSATKPLSITITAAPPTLTITTTSLPDGTVNQSYNATLADTGGTGAHTWDLASGSLPVGLSLSAAGVITGTPTTAGTSSPTFRVRDSGTPQQTATKQLSMTINLPTAPNITTTSLPAGSFNVAYNQTVGVTGGIGTLVWGVISGALPPGLGLNASTGNIAGTPTSTGSFQFTLRVTDQIPQFDEQALSITIGP